MNWPNKILPSDFLDDELMVPIEKKSAFSNPKEVD